MGRMDATLFVHPAQLMAVIQKKDQIDCKFYCAKKDCKFWKMGWLCATFLEAEMCANRSKPTQVVVNLVNKWFWHVCRWIYVTLQKFWFGFYQILYFSGRRSFKFFSKGLTFSKFSFVTSIFLGSSKSWSLVLRVFHLMLAQHK